MNDMTTSELAGDYADGPDFNEAHTMDGGMEIEFSNELVLLSGRGSLAAENVSQLVSEILSRHVETARRGLAFCTTSENSGCSYLAANVAVGVSMAGVRTLLIDANLREPKVRTYFRPSVEPEGLLQCLEDPRVALSDTVTDDVLPNLSVLYAGGQSAEAGLFASSRAGAVISEAMRNYDLTIVDCAPSNRSSDVLRIANMVRYALVVARKNHSYVNDLKKLIADIRQNNGEVLGTYLNDF